MCAVPLAASRARIFQCLGPAHNIHHFLGDGGLPRLVVVERQFLDQLGGIPAGAIHRCHARAVFCGRRFEQNAVGLRVEMLRQQRLEQLVFIRFGEIASA